MSEERGQINRSDEKNVEPHSYDLWRFELELTTAIFIVLYKII
jgi:hypothetical protein